MGRARRGTGRGFFDRNSTPRPAVIEGLIREGQIVAFGGTYGVGKSPLLADIAIHTVHGKRWCSNATGNTGKPKGSADSREPPSSGTRVGH